MKKFTSLAYHSIGDYPGNTYNIDIKDFKEQIYWLKSEGYIVEGFRDFCKRKITNSWPNRYVLLTFDDGYKSFLNAAEIINEIGFTGTFFITKNWCKRRNNFLSDSEIKELALMQEIGSHTVSHLNLTKISQNSIYYELFESKKWIEELIQTPISSLAIPGGFINSKIIKTAIELGYNLIGNSKEWWNNINHSKSSNIINRVAVRRSYSIETFHEIINMNIYFYLKRRTRSGLLYVPKYILSDQQIRTLYKLLSSSRKSLI